MPSASTLVNPHPRFQNNVRCVALLLNFSVFVYVGAHPLVTDAPSGNARGWNCRNRATGVLAPPTVRALFPTLSSLLCAGEGGAPLKLDIKTYFDTLVSS